MFGSDGVGKQPRTSLDPILISILNSVYQLILVVYGVIRIFSDYKITVSYALSFAFG